MVSNNNGLTWNQNYSPKGVRLNLMPNSSSSWEIQAKATGNTVFVIWRDHTPAYTTNGDELMMASTNAGLTWSPSIGTSPTDVSNDNQITGWSNGVGVSGNTVALAYMSDCVTGLQEPSPNSGVGDCGMMVSYSNNGGQSFFPQVNVSSDRTSGPITDIASSNFAVSGASVFVSWQDEPSTTFQVYFSATNGNVVQSPSSSINPVRGATGTVVTVLGSNFKASSSITLSFDSTPLTSVMSDASGGFSTSITVPSAVAGSHTISVSDGTTTQSENYNVVPNFALTPVKGATGTLVTVTGTGFPGSSSVTVTFGTTGQVATATTGTTGSFSTSFKTPASAGSNNVVATDTSSNSATGTFNEVTKISLSPVKGAIGKVVSVTGTGFLSSVGITVSYDGSKVNLTTSNSTGGFIATFTVPASTAGANTISATDGSTTLSSSYTVTPSVSITPKTSAGKNNIMVNVTGTGYAGGSQVTITFNGVVQSTSPITITTDNTGDFTAKFTVPTQRLQDYTGTGNGRLKQYWHSYIQSQLTKTGASNRPPLAGLSLLFFTLSRNEDRISPNYLANIGKLHPLSLILERGNYF